MTPKGIEFGERYADESGWARHLVIDVHAERVTIDLNGGENRVTLDDLWWLVRAALVARDKLGMDVLCTAGPASDAPGEKP
jgi:hypothetical protein